MVFWAKLGITVLDTILKLSISDPSKSTIADGTLKIFDIVGENYFDARKLQRKKDAISDRISESCNAILDHHAIDDDRKGDIIADLIAIIEDTDISYHSVFEKKFNFEDFYRLFSDCSTKLIVHYDTREIEIFERLLRHVALIIYEAVLQGPHFTDQGIKELFMCMNFLEGRLDEIIKKIAEIDRLVNTKEQALQKFDRLYRTTIKERYGWVRLLGANTIDRKEKKYDLSIAYVKLEMLPYDEDGKFVNPTELLGYSKTIFIEGNAGSGKTTFLQWLALASAANNISEIPLLRNTIPIMIELRSHHWKSLSINAVIESTIQESGVTIPENWSEDYLNSGKAVILIDGIDEVKREDREHIYDWIDDIREKYKKIWIIVTSRPNVEIDFAVDYTHVKILPMSPRKIDTFLTYWHKAVLVEKNAVSEEEAATIKQKLSLLISKSDSIRKLVSNPLLCAMICALNYKNGEIFSTRRNDLYDDCCKLLLASRDQARDIHTYDHLRLEYDDKRAILEYLAYWMMKNGHVSADKGDVLNCIGRAKKRLRLESQLCNDSEILDYFLERSGILCSPEVERIDFIHKSFQEYLAASEIFREDDWGFITEKAFQIGWYETLILSMGFASDKNAKKVINAILKTNNEESIVIAAACAENTKSLPQPIRQKIHAKLKGILPPKSIEDCKHLASAGEHVIPLLAFNEDYTHDQVYHCLVTLSYINSENILPVVGTYLHPLAEQRVIDCVERIACTYYDIDETSIFPEFSNSEMAISMKNYIIEMAKTGTVSIPESFIASFSELEDKGDIQILQGVTDLEIYHYCDICKDEYWKLFSNVHKLTVSGHFDSLDILCNFRNSLRSAIICDYSKTCDISLISRIDLPNIEALHIHTGREIYFDGELLSHFKSLQELGIYIYNNRSTIFLDHFSDLQSLRRVKVYAEFYADISYEDILEQQAIKELVIYIPYGYSKYEYDSFMAKLPDTEHTHNKPTVRVKIFDYPFGDELGSPTVYHY